MARVALIGSNGQLGTDIARLWTSSAIGRRDELIALTHADVDVVDAAWVRSVLTGVQPNLVINTSAFHRVDDCETQVREAMRVNAVGVKNVAEVCRDLGAVMMHFSTDYIFDGEKRSPYTEDDPPSPCSAYAISKLAGEHFLRYILPRDHILVRSSGLYGVAGASGKGGNFVETMLRFHREGAPIRVVSDQIQAPTYTLDLAAALLELANKGGRGAFHISNAGQCSWYDFATELFAMLGLRPDLTPVTSAEFGSPAQRPLYSVLDNGRLQELGIAQPRPWREALADYLRLSGQLAA
ncbi:MAG: dTDP-4-dehydrorhamnose reductase [Dehalococcoidia bacterium]|nr:dTDP-4-dehydrorhamnose reductase [Dehalococcoidia bacterium]